MERMCRSKEHIFISQPQTRFTLFKAHFNFQSAIKIKNAMEDKRGDDIFFLCHMRGLSPLEHPEHWPWPKDVVPKSIHPNDRNIEKMAILIDNMIKEEDVVLDPFLWFCGNRRGLHFA